MSNSGQKVIKNSNGILLVQYFKLKYFKNGKPNMHVERGYHVEVVECIPLSRYWFKSKKEALSYYNSLLRKE